MTWFKSKEQGKVYEVTAVIKAADKRLVNPLICHQCTC